MKLHTKWLPIKAESAATITRLIFGHIVSVLQMWAEGWRLKVLHTKKLTKKKIMDAAVSYADGTKSDVEFEKTSLHFVVVLRIRMEAHYRSRWVGDG